jgi:hypothetical protein
MTLRLLRSASPSYPPGTPRLAPTQGHSQNTAMLLIDHRVGTMGWIRSIEFDELKANALALAKAAKALDVPLVLASSMEAYAQGPLLSALEEIAPAEFASRIQRLEGPGTAWTANGGPITCG